MGNPPDPSGLFTQYQIWSSAIQSGPYSMIGTVNVYTQSSFTQTPSNANLQAQYYYVTTVSGTNTSIPSDTIRSIYLNLNNTGNGVINLNWNATHNPLYHHQLLLIPYQERLYQEHGALFISDQN